MIMLSIFDCEDMLLPFDKQSEHPSSYFMLLIRVTLTIFLFRMVTLYPHCTYLSKRKCLDENSCHTWQPGWKVDGSVSFTLGQDEDFISFNWQG